MTCKHRWHFISAETLKCQRCGAETGPKTSEQKVKEILEDKPTKPAVYTSWGLMGGYEGVCGWSLNRSIT